MIPKKLKKGPRRGCVDEFYLGQRFGCLTPMRRLENEVRRNGGARSRWECLCDCGNTTQVAGRNLISGQVLSCGCIGKMLRYAEAYLHIERSTRRWGMRHKHPMEWRSFHSAKTRCRKADRQSAYADVEFRFESFEQWLEELGPRPSYKHTVDRIDPFGHYEPGNVRWATVAEQNANKRDSDPNRLNQWLLVSYAEIA